jgi:hypothetical protein
MNAWSVRYLGMLLTSLIAASAAAYEHPLDSSAIRNAYFLGSSNSESVNLLSKYKTILAAPQTGPHVAEMEVRTPFAQVVAISREHSVGYSAQRAKQDYTKNPDRLQVRIQIRYTQTYPSALMPPPPCQGAIYMNSALDCFHDFQFRFRQEEQIEPISSYGVPIYSANNTSGLRGADIWFTFRTTDVTSAPLRVEISAPDGHEVSATFDLAALR